MVAVAGLVIAAVGAAVAGASAIQQGQNARTQANMTADAQKNTAVSVENQAAAVASNEKMKARRIEASQVAAAGAGGVSPSTGTPLTIETQTAEFGELNSLQIINNAQRTAWGYNTEANITQFGGEQKQDASYLQAGGSLLGGASSASFGYAGAGKGGVSSASVGYAGAGK
jgi:cytoskeletal protein RodZ